MDRARGPRRATTLVACLALLCLTGCDRLLNSHKRESDKQLQQQAEQTTKMVIAETRQATAQAKVAAAEAQRELKDVTTGVKEGLGSQAAPGSDIRKIVNINYDSEAQLVTLPGISPARARLIMNNRPYNTPQDLVTKHVLSREEFARVAGRVVAWDNPDQQ